MSELGISQWRNSNGLHTNRLRDRNLEANQVANLFAPGSRPLGSFLGMKSPIPLLCPPSPGVGLGLGSVGAVVCSAGLWLGCWLPAGGGVCVLRKRAVQPQQPQNGCLAGGKEEGDRPRWVRDQCPRAISRKAAPWIGSMPGARKMDGLWGRVHPVATTTQGATSKQTSALSRSRKLHSPT